MASSKSVDYAKVRELALALPRVTDSSTSRGFGFKAGGKLLACKAVHRSAEPESLVVRVGAGERDRLIAAHPRTYYVTAHYLAYESVLVRLTKINAASLQALFAIAWQFVAHKPAAARKPAKRRTTASVFKDL